MCMLESLFSHHQTQMENKHKEQKSGCNASESTSSVREKHLSCKKQKSSAWAKVAQSCTMHYNAPPILYNAFQSLVSYPSALYNFVFHYDTLHQRVCITVYCSLQCNIFLTTKEQLRGFCTTGKGLICLTFYFMF